MSTDFLHGIEVIEVNDGARPITTLKSSVIGIVGTAGKGPKNTPVMVTSLREAVNKFGGWDDTDGFTLPGALQSIYNQFKATVVVVNVVDEATDRTSVANEPFTFDEYTREAVLSKRFVHNATLAGTFTAKIELPSTALGTFTLPTGITVTAVKKEDGTSSYTAGTDYSIAANILSNLGAGISEGETVLVEFSATLVEGTDYTLEGTTGTLTVASDTVNLLPNSSGTVSFEYVNPTSATATDIKGGTDETTGNYEGIWALLSAKPVLGLTPRIILAPGFTYDSSDGNNRNDVVATLDVIAGRLGATALADGPNTTDEQAVAYRKHWGSQRIKVLDPHVIVGGPSGNDIEQPMSCVFAGIIARTDAEIGFWASPSNRLVKGIKGLARPVEYAAGDTNCRANYLNANQVTTIINEGGYRTWGNRTTSADPKWSFLNIRRAADIIQESILQAHLWAVDKNITKTLVEDVVEGVNRYLRLLQSRGAILGGTCWADPELNPAASISQGQLLLDFDFTVPYVAERISFRAHLVDDYVSEIFN